MDMDGCIEDGCATEMPNQKEAIRKRVRVDAPDDGTDRSRLLHSLASGIPQ